MSRQVRTKAIVLRRTNYGEADRILQLLTLDEGAVTVIAKGARREKSKLAGGIELFAVCDVSFIAGKGDMGTLTGSRLVIFYGHIIEQYDRLQFGYEAIKQIATASQQVTDKAFFHLLEQLFDALDDLAIDEQIVKSWFWLQLAILLGVGLNLSTDDNGMKLVEESRYDFDESEMSFVYKDNGRFTTQHIKLLRLMSAQSPKIVSQVKDVDMLVDDCLWLSERIVAR